MRVKYKSKVRSASLRILERVRNSNHRGGPVVQAIVVQLEEDICSQQEVADRIYFASHRQVVRVERVGGRIDSGESRIWFGLDAFANRIEYSLAQIISGECKALHNPAVSAQNPEQIIRQLAADSGSIDAGDIRVSVPLVAEIHVRGHSSAQREGNERPYAYCAGAEEVQFVAGRNSHVDRSSDAQVLTLPQSRLAAQDDVADAGSL